MKYLLGCCFLLSSMQVTAQSEGASRAFRWGQVGAKASSFFRFSETEPDVVWDQKCYPGFSGKITYNYCVTRTQGSDSKDVLYFFHGAFGDEKDWTEGANAEYRRALRLHWQDHNLQAPIVVSISLGSLWMLREHESTDGDPANFSALVDIAIPEIEAKHFDGEFLGRRLLMGVSMGGFNALTLFMKRPKMWNRAALIAPMMPLCNPYLAKDYSLFLCVSQDEQENNAFLAFYAHKLIQDEFPTANHWARANPLNIVQSNMNQESPPLLMTTGRDDKFGFYTNNEKFAQAAQEQMAPIFWVPTDYEHGVFDPEMVGDFLLAD